MMVNTCYLRKGSVFLPTMAKVVTGGHQEIDPVFVAPVNQGTELQHALQTMIAAGNPIIPSYSFADNPPAAVLKYAGVKTFGAFARDALAWIIEEKDGTFQIVGQRRRQPRGWVDDPEQTITFPAGTRADEVAARMVAILQAAATKS
jgi:hypothetical protein